MMAAYRAATAALLLLSHSVAALKATPSDDHHDFRFQEQGLTMHAMPETVSLLQGTHAMGPPPLLGGNKMPPVLPPKLGMRTNLTEVLAKIPQDCEAKVAKIQMSDPGDCNRTASLVELLLKASDYPEPTFTWEATYRGMLGLNFWLYVPGTMLCFTILDMDNSGGVTFDEMSKIFGLGLMQQFDHTGLFRFMDTSGNATADGSITREDLHAFLRAAVVLRDYLPTLDAMDPTATTEKCMMMAGRVLHPPPKPLKQMNHNLKLLSIFGIMIGAFALHCLCCVKRTGEPVKNSKEAKDAKKEEEEEDAEIDEKKVDEKADATATK